LKFIFETFDIEKGRHSEVILSKKSHHDFQKKQFLTANIRETKIL